jgi:hypothetical protein
LEQEQVQEQVQVQVQVQEQEQVQVQRQVQQEQEQEQEQEQPLPLWVVEEPTQEVRLFHLSILLTFLAPLPHRSSSSRQTPCAQSLQDGIQPFGVQQDFWAVGEKQTL